MKCQIASISLDGTQRSVDFRPGLNIIAGPIASGKTTLFRLLRALLGGNAARSIPELHDVRTISGELSLRDISATVQRRLVGTPNAPVDVRVGDDLLRLPAHRGDTRFSQTYGDWLLETLGLPVLDIPAAPSDPESAPTPVTINDYMLLCQLKQDEIDSDAFGSDDRFSDIKRRFALRVVYGSFDPAVGELYEKLRRLRERLTQAGLSKAAFSEALSSSPHESEEVLRDAMAAAATELAALRSASETGTTPDNLRALLTKETQLQRQQVELSAELDLEQEALDEAYRLDMHIGSQISKLMKTLAAENLMAEFDFVVCPRCQASVDPDRADAAHCYLCLQTPPKNAARDAVFAEIASLEAQVSEARELHRWHSRRLERARYELAAVDDALRMNREQQEEIKSDSLRQQATAAAVTGERVGRLTAEVERFRDYLGVYDRLGQQSLKIAELESQIAVLKKEISQTEHSFGAMRPAFDVLDRNYRETILGYHPPSLYGVGAEPSMDYRSYLPLVNGRTVTSISSPGYAVLMNVAFAVALQKTALELDQPLPGILFIDGVTQNIGHEGDDRARVEAVYDSLARLGYDAAGACQIIVADNDIPDSARPYVAVEFSDTDRLVPQLAVPLFANPEEDAEK